MSSWNTSALSHQTSHGPSLDGVNLSDSEWYHSTLAGSGCAAASGSADPHVRVAPVTVILALSSMNSFSYLYLLALNALVKDTTLSAGAVLKVPLNPDADASIVAMNWDLPPAEALKVAAGLDIQPWPLTTDAASAEASKHA
ncbi:unnamed protein product [Phytophthora lilii]|uniref:Unnamed protein product n=1 Tax=Phytophthora lilii TaxID=2077276 RepID=A0A9W6YFL7_9STRA|nr:unnamed protein product [Phytophthora lilii]